MTTRTKISFFFIMSLAAVVVAGVLILEQVGAFTVPTRGETEVNIQVSAAPGLEPWVRDAARDFNRQHPNLTVDVVILNGLEANQKLAPTSSNLPDAWIAEAEFVRGMAGTVPYPEQGPTVAQTRLVWLAVKDRTGLQGNLDWPTIHEAAVNPTAWQTLGSGDSRFDLALPSPGNSVEGVAAYLSAAADYFNQDDLSSVSVTDQGFLAWMDEILQVVPEQRTAPLNQLTRTPVSVDVGLLLESDFDQVARDQFIIQTPAHNIIFASPYLIRRNNPADNAADRQRTAEQFRDFLLSDQQQAKLAAQGFIGADDPSLGQGVQVDGETALRLRGRVGQ